MPAPQPPAAPSAAEAVECLAGAVDAKDPTTGRHQREVSRLAVAVAGAVDPSLAASPEFGLACLLHDVGKIGVPEPILRKPGPLDDDEWETMRRHPEIGARLIAPLRLPAMVRDVVLHHHERWDGEGYPSRLRGEEIPLAARVLSVCDSLEAMTAPRPYRAALPVPLALERIRLEAGHQFDPRIVAALDRALLRDRSPLMAALERIEASGLTPRITRRTPVLV